MIYTVSKTPVEILARCQSMALIKQERGEPRWESLERLFADGGHAEFEAALALAKPVPRYRVRYYDKVLSHKGQGVQSRTFDDEAAAAEFASKNRLYAKPCKVEALEP